MDFVYQEANTIVCQSTSLQTLAVIDTVSKKTFNLPLLPCLILQAAWLKRFYCFVLALALLRLVNLKVDQNSWDVGILFDAESTQKET